MRIALYILDALSVLMFCLFVFIVSAKVQSPLAFPSLACVSFRFSGVRAVRWCECDGARLCALGAESACACEWKNTFHFFHYNCTDARCALRLLLVYV